MPTETPGRGGALFAFVIPVLNEAGNIGALLERLRRDFPGAETVVVDGGSTDGTVEAATAAGALVVHSERGRALQMNAGAARSHARYLLFLHADCVPGFDGRALRRQLLRNPPWGFLRVRLDGPAVLAIVAASMNLRAALTSIATGDMLLLVRRDVWEQAGGYAPIPLMEDIELCGRLRRRHRPMRLGLPVLASGRRWQERGVLRTIAGMWLLRLRYWLGTDPVRLHRRYYGGA